MFIDENKYGTLKKRSILNLLENLLIIISFWLHDKQQYYL